MDYQAQRHLGRRYLKAREFCDFANRLGLFPRTDKHLLEFLEREAVLAPVARVRFPPEIARAWHKQRYPTQVVPEPVETDTERLANAQHLCDLLQGGVSLAALRGHEIDHPLDEVAPEHAEFVKQDFPVSEFRPWSELRADIAVVDGTTVWDGGQSVHTYYHAWQIFGLAAFLRSAATLLYNPHEESLAKAIWHLDFGELERRRIRLNVNIDGRHELSSIREHAVFFEAVAYFRHRASLVLQHHARTRDPETGRLSVTATRQLQHRRRELAKEALSRYSLRPSALFKFIETQIDLWDDYQRRGPPALATALQHELSESMWVYRLATRTSGPAFQRKLHKSHPVRGGLLDRIFPDWIVEQRRVVEASLQQWIRPNLDGVPAPLQLHSPDIPSFCDWIEHQGLFQFYWHFRRLTDLRFRDDAVADAGSTIEAVALAALAEHVANAVLVERGASVPMTLLPKLRDVFGPSSHYDMENRLREFSHLTRTTSRTLRQQLATISRISRGADAVALKVLLRLGVIRNAASHVGLATFDRDELHRIVRSLITAILLIWKSDH